MKSVLFFVIGVFISSFLSAQNECNPNNSFGQACEIPLINLMGSINGSINPVNDADYYYFVIPRSGVITYRVTNVPSNIAMVAALFSDYDQSQAISSVSGGNGQSVEGIKKVCPAGKYYVRLYDNFSNPDQSPDLYTLKVTLDTSDVHECNDNFVDCTPIALNQNVQGAINSTGDFDFYCFDIPRSGVITYRVTNVPDNIAMVAALIPDYDQSQVISSVSGGNGQSVEGIKKVCPAGKYYVKIYDNFSNPDQSPVLYTLKVTLDTTDIYECNDEFATAKAIKFCNIRTGAINAVGDKDFYKFEVSSTDSVHISVTNVANNITMEGRLYKPDFLPLSNAFYASGLGLPLYINYLMPNSGTYYLVLNDRNNDNFNASLYTLNVKFGCTVSSENPTLEEKVKIYPNPVEDNLFIDIADLNNQDFSVNIISSMGSIILRQSPLPNNKTIDLSLLPKGLYFIQIGGKDGFVTKQFVKQ